MSVEFRDPIDLNQLELQNAQLQQLGSDPVSPVEGQIWYRGDLDRARVQTGTTGQSVAWVSELYPYDDTKDPTGFVENQNITVTYDGAARTITLTTTDPQLYYLWHGERKALGTTTWTSTAHANSAGAWFLYSTDGVNFIWSNTVWKFSDIQVAGIRYVSSAKYISLREVHGLMPWTCHRDSHLGTGTIRNTITTPTGGTVGGYTIGSSVAADRRPSVTAIDVLDEDLVTSIPALADNGPYSHLYLASQVAVDYDLNTQLDIVHLSGVSAQYQNPVTAAWVNIGNNNFANIYLVAVPATSDTVGQYGRWLWMQPQASYPNLPAAQAEGFQSINKADLANAFAEYVPVAKVTIKAVASYFSIEAVEFLATSRAAASSSGSQGLQGITGVQGLTGIDGLQGVQGLTGTVGITGTPGITGRQGLTGTNGVQGITGANGVQGITGLQGVQGLTGTVGITGTIGITGTPGITGRQGLTGLQGITGLPGVQGLTGTVGITGTIGITGTPGITGRQGLTGLQGITGQPGVNAGGGTTNVLAKFTAATTIGNSNITDTGTTITNGVQTAISSLTASRAIACDASKILVSSATTATELGYLSGVTSAVQTQLDGKAKIAGWNFTPTSTAGSRIPLFRFIQQGSQAVSYTVVVARAGTKEMCTFKFSCVTDSGVVSRMRIHLLTEVLEYSATPTNTPTLLLYDFYASLSGGYLNISCSCVAANTQYNVYVTSDVQDGTGVVPLLGLDTSTTSVIPFTQAFNTLRGFTGAATTPGNAAYNTYAYTGSGTTPTLTLPGAIKLPTGTVITVLNATSASSATLTVAVDAADTQYTGGTWTQVKYVAERYMILSGGEGANGVWARL